MSLPILDSAPVHVPGERERALTALWDHVGREFYRLRNWRNVVRLRRRFSLRPLRVRDVVVKMPRQQLPDCESCLELCCTGPDAVVSLRLRDIAVLADLGRTDLLAWERPPTPPKAGWARREADGSVFHRAFPILRRDATGTCAALTDERLCGLYPSWPLSCARYPYALDLQLKVVFYAKGCGTPHLTPPADAPLHVRRLVHAVVDAYNARLRDIVLLAMARPALADLGLLEHVRVDELGF